MVDDPEVAALVSKFVDKMAPVVASKKRYTLGIDCTVDGRFAARAEHIVRMVRGGWTTGVREKQRAMIDVDGCYILERALTRTAIDFAEFVAGYLAQSAS